MGAGPDAAERAGQGRRREEDGRADPRAQEMTAVVLSSPLRAGESAVA